VLDDAGDGDGDGDGDTGDGDADGAGPPPVAATEPVDGGPEPTLHPAAIISVTAARIHRPGRPAVMSGIQPRSSGSTR
jgi:hypothetical protein